MTAVALTPAADPVFRPLFLSMELTVRVSLNKHKLVKPQLIEDLTGIIYIYIHTFILYYTVGILLHIHIFYFIKEKLNKNKRRHFYFNNVKCH